MALDEDDYALNNTLTESGCIAEDPDAGQGEKCLTSEAQVTVEMTGTDGAKVCYTFNPIAKEFLEKATPPLLVNVHPWGKLFEGSMDPAEEPNDIFSVGNTIYWYCSVVYYDQTNKLFGLKAY